jgi:hypothetical protein
MGITGTPTFLVGALEPDGRIRLNGSFPGFASLEQLRELVKTVGDSVR